MKKIALVTGGNRGLGFAICELLAENNIKVILGSRNKSLGTAAAKKLKDKGLDVTTIELDVSDLNSIVEAHAVISSQFGPLSILINNAGVLFKTPLLTAPKSEIDTTLSVNLMGPLHCIRTFAPDMLKLGYGRIVNVSSEWGAFSQNIQGPGFYGVSKAGLNAITLNISNNLPSFIKINSVSPGWVHTDMGGSSAPLSPQQGAETIIWLATLPGDGPTGGFFQNKKSIAW